MSLFGSKKTKTAEPKPKTEEKKTAQSMRDLYSDAAPSFKSASGRSGEMKSVTTGKPAASFPVLVKPLITEKATNLSATDKYVFVVSCAANKIAVAKAVYATYGVKPLKVNLVNVSGKRVTRGRISGSRKDWRKAIVTLPKGKAIKIYEGV